MLKFILELGKLAKSRMAKTKFSLKKIHYSFIRPDTSLFCCAVSLPNPLIVDNQKCTSQQASLWTSFFSFEQFKLLTTCFTWSLSGLVNLAFTDHAQFCYPETQSCHSSKAIRAQMLVRTKRGPARDSSSRCFSFSEPKVIVDPHTIR